MKGAPGLVATVTLSFIVGACAAATAPTPLASLAPAPTLSATPTQGSTPTASSTALIQDIMAFEPLGPIGAGTYFIDPDGDPSTPLRVVYDVPADGWSKWIGAAKFSDAGHVGLSITTVANLVTDGCTRPCVGRSTGRTERRRPRRGAGGAGPVRGDVAAERRDRLRLQREASGMDRARPAGRGSRQTSDASPNATKATSRAGSRSSTRRNQGTRSTATRGPGYREEFWILDVEGTRLMIAAEQSPGSPSEDIAERDAILDSIRIEP